MLVKPGGAEHLASGRANMILQGRAYGLTKRATLLELLELSTCADRPVRTYSGGQRRRLDLALGIVHRPQLLFLDEPSTGLDPQAVPVCGKRCVSFMAQVRLFSLTTHYLEEADTLCNRLAIIDGGKIVAEGTPAQLKQQIAGDVVTSSLDKEMEHSPRPTAPDPGICARYPTGSPNDAGFCRTRRKSASYYTAPA